MIRPARLLAAALALILAPAAPLARIPTLCVGPKEPFQNNFYNSRCHFLCGRMV